MSFGTRLWRGLLRADESGTRLFLGLRALSGARLCRGLLLQIYIVIKFILSRPKASYILSLQNKKENVIKFTNCLNLLVSGIFINL